MMAFKSQRACQDLVDSMPRHILVGLLGSLAVISQTVIGMSFLLAGPSCPGTLFGRMIERRIGQIDTGGQGGSGGSMPPNGPGPDDAIN
jgi:hypothetical protein